MENGLSHYNYHQAYLRVKLLGAEGIDEPNLHASVVNKDYWVVLWVRPDEEYRTESVEEVLRFNSVNDLGTSRGIVVVERARIPLPKKFDSEKKGALDW
ncbi:hypothetical protein SESBI_29126 [Sesbania bispinosa]|nr:hypothetical protein SESBI_29126 [Sesbania bispinosa]